MDEAIVHQIVDEIFSSLEPLDTQSAALLQFLKDKGMVSDEAIAPYLEQAGKASGVRWLALRVRINSLIASALKNVETEPARGNPEKAKSAETEAKAAPEKGAPGGAGETGKQGGETAQASERRDSAGRDSERHDDAQADSAEKDTKAHPEKAAAVTEKDDRNKEHQSTTSGRGADRDSDKRSDEKENAA